MPEYRIEEPANYFSVKTFAAGAMMAWDRKRLPEVTESLKAYCWASWVAMGYQTPTFFVAPELLAAALRTELPVHFRFENLHWPFPSLVLMLPKGSLRHQSDGDPAFICLSLIPEKFQLPDREILLPQPELILVSLMPETVLVQIYHATIVLTPGLTIWRSTGTRFR